MRHRKIEASSTENLKDFLFPETKHINLRRIFKEVYYYLYTNSKIPRAERLAAEMIRLVFCKIFDEAQEKRKFVVRDSEDDDELQSRIVRLFELVKSKYDDVFDPTERLLLDAASLRYVVSRLQKVNLTKLNVDAVGEAFQEFIGPSLRGEKGQFFTPRTLVRGMTSMLEPSIEDRIIDPACGTGGFLIAALKYLQKSSEGEFSPSDFTKNLFGIDKEIDQAKYSKTYMAILGDGRTNIFCEDSLNPNSWDERTKLAIKDETFDIVVTNPPFGANIPLKNKEILQKYQLGHKWIKRRGSWQMTNEILPKQDPQLLFLERCIQLCKPGGRIGIVLPEGPFCNLSQAYIFEFIRMHATILAVIDCPRVLFQPSTDTKTNVLILQKGKPTSVKDIFMTIVKKCGHNKRGEPVYRSTGQLDDGFPEVANRFKHRNRFSDSRLGFWANANEIVNDIYIPRYYDPEVKETLSRMEKSGKFILSTIRELVDQGILSIRRGIEVGSSNYGLGNVPFIRTSDISNWEVSHNPPFCVSEEIYEKMRKRIDLKPLDILFANDGRYRIGNTAMLLEGDTRIVVQSHIRILRILKPKDISPYLLFHILNSEAVKHQIESKIFIQSTIATLGSRLKQIILPIPKDKIEREKIEREVSEILVKRSKLRKRMDILTNYPK